MNSIAAAEPAPNAAYLWVVLREYVRHAFALFGAPSEIAKKIWLSRAEHKLILTWIKPLEALLRRLILLDALKLAAESAPTPTPPRETKTRIRCGMSSACGAAFDMENSESWRVSFDLGAHAPRQTPRPSPRGEGVARSATGGAAAQLTSATHVNAISSAAAALRLEALVRGYNNREQMAERLARKLQQKPAILQTYLEPPPRKRAAQPGWACAADAATLCCDAIETMIAEPSEESSPPAQPDSS